MQAMYMFLIDLVVFDGEHVRVRVHWIYISLSIFMFYQAGDEDDEARKVGSESDVLDFVEAHVKSSLAALATHSGDDATSLGDDAKVCV